MTKVKFKKNPNFEKELHNSIVEKLREKVEINYCIKHNKFAKLIVIDPQTFSWRIESCCEALANKAVESLQQGE